MVRAIIQIIPAAPPFVNGVGDYALAVARELRATWEINSSFLVCNPTWEGPRELEGFRLVPMPSRMSDDLRTGLHGFTMNRPVIALLQLSPYGYDQNGSPFWLLDGLTRWKKEDPAGHKLFTYFHELYAMSMPWRRGFWVSPFQRICSRRIARLSDIAFTSMERYVERLNKWDPTKSEMILRMPVVSNVGEPSEMPALVHRSRRLTIWGSVVARQEIYGRHHEILEAAVNAIGIEQIVDVGNLWQGAPTEVAGVPVKAVGILPSEKLSHILIDSVLATFSYNPNYLAKSGMFAAFCAHGVPAICLPTTAVEHRTWDGICRGVHFLTSVPSAEDGVMKNLTQISKNAHTWYIKHRISEHAGAIARMMLEDVKADQLGNKERHATIS